MTPAADAVAARRSALAVAFFTWVMQRQMAASFPALRLARPGLDPSLAGLAADRPIVVYSNHPAWWDPALFIVLAQRLFAARESYGPMDAAALSQYRILERAGIFGIETESYRGAARFMRVATGLLDAPQRMLWITAQGEFADPRDRPVALRPGLARLLARVPEAVALPLAVEYPFWSEKKPEALCRFGAPRLGAEATDKTLTTDLATCMNALAEDAIAREPARFDTLIAGGAGVGGIYDLGRRIKAALAGRAFDARHDRDAS